MLIAENHCHNNQDGLQIDCIIDRNCMMAKCLLHYPFLFTSTLMYLQEGNSGIIVETTDLPIYKDADVPTKGKAIPETTCLPFTETLMYLQRREQRHYYGDSRSSSLQAR
jgi:hypothetical protein